VPPGEKYVYSNFGYVVAGAMAEQVDRPRPGGDDVVRRCSIRSG